MANERTDGTPTPVTRVETAELPGTEAVAAILFRAAARHRGVGQTLDRAGEVVQQGGSDAVLADLADELVELAGIDAGAARAVRRLIERPETQPAPSWWRRLLRRP